MDGHILNKLLAKLVFLLWIYSVFCGAFKGLVQAEGKKISGLFIIRCSYLKR